jgi:hypothetical protein
MASAVGGLASSIFGSTPSPSSSAVQLPGLASDANTFNSTVNSRLNNNPYDTYSPQATATFNAAYNNPYASTYQNSANQAGAQYGSTGTADMTSANTLTGAGNTGTAAAIQLLQMGYDPQNALYNQQKQQSADTANATNAATGLTSSPYGASVANNAATNFNNSWQNQQLQRAIQALSGYTSGVAGASSDYSNANTLGNAGASATAQAGAVPYAASTDVTNQQSTALQNLLSVLGNSGAGAFDQSTLTDLMAYLQTGAKQQSTLYNNELDASNASNAGIGSDVSNAISLASNPTLSSLISSAFF